MYILVRVLARNAFMMPALRRMVGHRARAYAIGPKGFASSRPEKGNNPLAS